MIYTIGYQRLAPERLLQIAEGLDAVIIDVRSIPRSRKRGFGRRSLETLLGRRYQWRGDGLGGLGEISPIYIQALRQYQGDAILMCLEEAPGDCHRHWDICAPHIPDAMHIFRDEIFTARELQRAIDDGDDYSVAASLSDLLALPKSA
jgi:uncharacterized protein (DUF488 family)